LPFAVTHPTYADVAIETLKQKFNIQENYFYSPNQFWAHKNHKVVVEAIELIKKEFENILVVFSGKESDYRNATFVDDLKKLVKDKGLEKNILFLGFIDRKEQLCLMKNALAIIQPSLFEGWSTVVEDAKAMNQFVIASDLRVHREQLKQNALFFEPANEFALVEAMKKVLNKEFENKDNDYKQDIHRFAKRFLQIVNCIKPSS
jgi:glycosyltransferase involved in cell wall biosynthesis